MVLEVVFCIAFESKVFDSDILIMWVVKNTPIITTGECCVSYVNLMVNRLIECDFISIYTLYLMIFIYLYAILDDIVT